MSNWPIEIINLAKYKLNQLDWFNFDITPTKDQVLRFLEIDPQTIKVVILGQDPYPTKNVANGFAFAVNKGSPLSQSLKNIFKEIYEVLGSLSTDETLESWVKQGVLLLNTSLTTIVNKPLAHKDYWKDLIHLVIEYLVQEIKPIWILWGNFAKSYKSYLNQPIIMDAHPSPLSFHMRKKNTFLEIQKYIKINW